MLVTWHRPRLALAALVAVIAVASAVACSDDGFDDEQPARTITPFVPRPSTPTPEPTAAPARAVTPTPPRDAEQELDARIRGLVHRIAGEPSALERSAILHAMEEVDDPRFVAPLIHLWAFSGSDRDAIAALLERIVGEDYGTTNERWFFGWYDWLAAHPDWPVQGDYGLWLARLIHERQGVNLFRFLQAAEPSQIRPELILWSGRSVDGGPPLDRPAFITAEEAAGVLQPDETVFGVVMLGEARAYPLRIVQWHEVVNDAVSGTPVSLSYSPLSDSATLYGGYRNPQSLQEQTFGSSGLVYEGATLLYDRQTDSLWSHTTGRPVLGLLGDSGAVLPRIPLVHTTWAEWSATHPGTLVLDLDTGHQYTYEPGATRGDLALDELDFPVAQRSDLLPHRARVFALRVPGAAHAVPAAALPPRSALNDTAGETPFVLAVDAGGGARAYLRGNYQFRPGNLAAAAGPLTLLDQNGATWRVQEDALVSESGELLARLAGDVTFWFAWYAAYPETTVYGTSP